MNYSRKILFAGFAFFALSTGMAIAVPAVELKESSQQQAGTLIRGKVVDSSGEPIIGVNVLVKSTNKRAVTDVNGSFSIEGEKGTVLELSYIGYINQRVVVGNSEKLQIVLKENLRLLGEVVVVGYGVQQKKSVIAAVSQVTSEELLKSGGASSVGEALQGKLPGVTAIYSSGRPGQKDVRFYIRGQSTWNGGGQPLVMIDGVEGSMEDVDVNEVSNISVLKDASATAVYGVKGASGVILITTKRGEKGKADMSFKTEFTVKSVSKLPEQMDAYDAAGMANRTILNELAYNPGAWGSYMPSSIQDKYRNQVTQRDKETFPNVDWADYMLKDNAKDQKVNFSVSGGTDFVKYYCTVSYLHEGDIFRHFENNKGYETGFEYNRFNYRSNLDFDITKTTKLGVNISGAYGITKQPNSTGEERMYAGIYRLGPMQFYPIHEDGTYGFDLSGDYELRNPVSDFSSGGYKNDNRLTMINDITLDQKLNFITKGLNFKGRYTLNNIILSQNKLDDGGNASQYIRKAYVNDGKDVIYAYPITYNSDFAFSPDPWTLTKYELNKDERMRRTNYELSLNYGREFGKHSVSALGLWKREQYTKGNMFPIFREDWVGRLTYNYASKYFIETNGAYNGSEKYGPGNRFGFFPSVALGWMVSEESLFKKMDWLDKLKIRASYGKAGDDNFDGRWKYMTQWGSYGKALEMNKFNYDNTRFSPYNLYKEMSLGNPDIHWEYSIKRNIGLEFAALRNAIKLEVDVFQDNRNDIMMSGNTRSIPMWIGINAPDANLGSTEVKGYEMVLGSNHTVGEVELKANFTYSHVVDKVSFKDDAVLKSAYQQEAGKSIGQNKSMIPGEIMKSWDDVYMATALSDGQSSKRIGYYDLIDYNSDGDVNSSYDNVPWGYPNRPQNTWTAELGAEYKGFGVTIQFYGQNNTTRKFSLDDHVKSQKMYFKENADVWTPENPDGTRAYTAWGVTKANNDPLKFIYDGSMVRLKMAEIFYFIPKKVCKSIGVKSVRLFANGYNLALWTSLPDDRDFNGANDYRGGYPTMRRMNFGFNLNF